jgi:hypothetical protein
VFFRTLKEVTWKNMAERRVGLERVERPDVRAP